MKNPIYFTSSVSTFVGFLPTTISRNAFLSILCWYSRSCPTAALMAYLVSTLTVGFISEKYLTYPPSIWDFLSQIIPIVIIGGGIYLVITYFIDKPTRKLFKSIINEIRKK